jgi:hypothetical protein
MRKDDELLRCTACRNTFYCSKECQAADWASGHRKLCKNALNRIHGMPSLSSFNIMLH